MAYDPRTIAFLADIIYPPLELPAEKVQEIHNSLYRQPEFSYQNFQVTTDGIHLTNLADSPGSVSSVTFTPDRISVREELRACTIEDFATRVINIATLSFQTLGISHSIAQQFILRSLVTPRHLKDSRELLAGRMIAATEEAWPEFGRPLQTAGLHFTFPQTDDDVGVFDVRMETWNQDPRSLWIENIGSFTLPLAAENIPDLSNFLYRTYRFITDPVARFIQHFDTP